MTVEANENATPGARAWRSDFGEPADGVLSAGFLRRDVVHVARDLLGTRLISTIGGERVSAVVVETEAYRGPDDPASHAATRAGMTERNRAMFGRPGRAYVYLIYGMHWCLNVVTGEEDLPQAVLLRGAEVLEGCGTVRERRGREGADGGSRGLLAGPGCLCQGLGVTGALYGHELQDEPLRLAPGWSVPDEVVRSTGRIGVRSAWDRPWRFVVEGSPGVTRARPRQP